VGLAFLNKKSPEWKQRFVKSFIPMSAPFGGAVSALQAVISGRAEPLGRAPDAVSHTSPPRLMMYIWLDSRYLI
jgi:hypothetical protein